VITQPSEMAPCPKCGRENRFFLISVIDVDDQADWRDEIVERTLSQEACGNCGTLYRIQPHFAFFDREHDLWIGAFPWNERTAWRACDQQARSLYDVYLQAPTAMSSRMHEAPLNRRITFGWEALREKIVAASHGLDDATLELLKRDVDQSPLGRAREESDLRLLDADATELILGRVIPPAEHRKDQMSIPRARYDAAVDDPAGRRLRNDLLKEAYVDLRRLQEKRKRPS
jgi:hypothetical protein